MSGLTRQDEHKLRDLNEAVLKRGIESLSEDECLQLSLLQDRYNKFLEEGVRALKSGGKDGKGMFRPPNNRLPPSKEARVTPTARITASGDEQDLLGSPYEPQNTVDSNECSPCASPVPQSAPLPALGNPPILQVGDEILGTHWTWLFDYLIIGAVPYSGATTDLTGHLSELRDQCTRRGARISVVVNCMEMDEAVPCGFATPKDWDSVFGPISYSFVSLPRDAQKAIGKATIQEVITACAQLSQLQQSNARQSSSSLMNNSSMSSEVLTGSFGEEASPNARTRLANAFRRRLTTTTPPSTADRKQVAFIHCKAGQMRCAIVAACFLLSQYSRSPDDAMDILTVARPQLRPSEAQKNFVRLYSEYISQPIIREQRSDEEEQYQRVLADVLSLLPESRMRLLRDLEKLT